MLYWIIDIDTFAAPELLSLFQSGLPLEWIQQALDEINKASIRRRKLPT